LRAVKADIKVFIFQWSHSKNGKLPVPIEEIFTENISGYNRYRCESEMTVARRGDGRLMFSSLVSRTAAMMAAAITSVDAKFVLSESHAQPDLAAH
jgi:hypothetical protein